MFTKLTNTSLRQDSDIYMQRGPSHEGIRMLVDSTIHYIERKHIQNKELHHPTEENIIFFADLLFFCFLYHILWKHAHLMRPLGRH